MFTDLLKWLFTAAVGGKALEKLGAAFSTNKKGKWDHAKTHQKRTQKSQRDDEGDGTKENNKTIEVVEAYKTCEAESLQKGQEANADFSSQEQTEGLTKKGSYSMKKILIFLLFVALMPICINAAEMHTIVGVGGTSIDGEWSTTAFTGFNTTLLSKQDSSGRTIAEVFQQTGYAYVDDESNIQSTETWTMLKKYTGFWNLYASIGTGVSIEISDGKDEARTGFRSEVSYEIPKYVEIFVGYKHISAVGPDWKTIYGGLNLLAF